MRQRKVRTELKKMNKNEIDDIQFYISTLIQVESSKPERSRRKPQHEDGYDTKKSYK